jgi:hypothetical protein
MDDVVIDFMRAFPDRPCCHQCLSLMVDLSHEEVREVTTRRRTVDLVVQAGTWANCERPRVVVSFKRATRSGAIKALTNAAAYFPGGGSDRLIRRESSLA